MFANTKKLQFREFLNENEWNAQSLLEEWLEHKSKYLALTNSIDKAILYSHVD